MAGHVARTYSKFIRDYPAVGWTRASAETTEELQLALAEARLRIANLEAEKIAPEDQAPEGAETLAQGQENVSFLTHFRYEWIDDRGDFNRRRNANRWVEIEITWDEIFASVAPKMLDESDESGLEVALSDWVFEREFSVLVQKALDGYKGAERKLRDETMRSFSLDIDKDAFGVIVLQLVALGLIQKSEKRRSVRDSTTYWTLTPYGLSYATRLRARRKGSDPAIHTINRDDLPSDEDVADS